jgi:hypothetical protein
LLTRIRKEKRAFVQLGHRRHCAVHVVDDRGYGGGLSFTGFLDLCQEHFLFLLQFGERVGDGQGELLVARSIFLQFSPVIAVDHFRVATVCKQPVSLLARYRPLLDYARRKVS